MSTSNESRANQTKSALLKAFNELVFQGGESPIYVADVIRQADVGRSTFYDHFSGADDIHMQALSGPMSILADAITGNGSPEKLTGLLDHFWEQRQRAVATFLDSKMRDNVTRLLAGQLNDHFQNQTDAESNGISHRHLAESAMSLVRVWINGEVTCDAKTLAGIIIRTSELLRSGAIGI